MIGQGRLVEIDLILRRTMVCISPVVYKPLILQYVRKGYKKQQHQEYF